MMQLVPEQYQAMLAANANVDAPTAQFHETMHNAYKQLGAIDRESVWCMQDQGAVEINIGILAHHMKRELDRIGRTRARVDDQLQKILKQVNAVEAAATRKRRYQ